MVEKSEENSENLIKKVEEQVMKWSKQIENGNYERVTAEASVASYMTLFNIDQNLSLIRDMLAVLIKEQQK